MCTAVGEIWLKWLTIQDIFSHGLQDANASVGVFPTETVQHNVHALRCHSAQEQYPPVKTFEKELIFQERKTNPKTNC